MWLNRNKRSFAAVRTAAATRSVKRGNPAFPKKDRVQDTLAEWLRSEL